MAPDLEPIDVARHWPFLRRHLHLERNIKTADVLSLVARLQVTAEGAPVELGAKRLAALLEATAGEAGRLRVVLASLEERRVLYRQRARGSHPDAWSFFPDVAKWRRMPWRWSGREVEQAIGSCICRAGSAIPARIPGQSMLRLREEPEFRLLDADHLWRPGLLPVETRGYGEGRAAMAKRTGKTPVETRDKLGPAAPPVLSSGDLYRDLSLNAETRERLERFMAGLGGPVMGRLVTELVAIARQPWTTAQIDAALRALDERRLPDGRRLGVPLRVAYLGEVLRSPGISALGDS